MSSINWFCRVSALARRSLVCRVHIGFAVCRLLLNVRSCIEHKLVLPLPRVSSINWFCRVSALARRSLLSRANFGFAVCRFWLNVPSCVEHNLALPCVGFSFTFARVLGRKFVFPRLGSS